jgi:hypothetical protein
VRASAELVSALPFVIGKQRFPASSVHRVPELFGSE